MEYLGEKVAYLKGLAEGLKVDETTNEGKLLLSIIDVLDSMTDSIADLEQDIDELTEQVDEIDEDLAAVEDDIYEDDEDGCSCCGHDDEDEDGMEFYEVTCDECGEKIYLDEDMLDSDEPITCPNCGCNIEIEYECDDEDCDCHHEE